MIIDNKRDKVEEFEPLKELKLEILILIYLRNVKNESEPNNEKDLDDKGGGSLVKEILINLPTTSKDYLYRRIGDLESRGCIKDKTPDNRDKHLVITNTGEDELISIVKIFFPKRTANNRIEDVFRPSLCTEIV